LLAGPVVVSFLVTSDAAGAPQSRASIRDDLRESLFSLGEELRSARRASFVVAEERSVRFERRASDGSVVEKVQYQLESVDSPPGAARLVRIGDSGDVEPMATALSFDRSKFSFDGEMVSVTLTALGPEPCEDWSHRSRTVTVYPRN
ncbi:MAG: hypothetical protein AAF488_12860, partial [Planctomycetota bacterium]